MSFAPLFAASLAIRLHAFAALACFAMGLVQFAAPKGTLPHRTLGYVWVVLMAVVALSSFSIHTICTIGGFSVIHLLSVATLILLPVAVMRARHHQVTQHKRTMGMLFLGALVIAGAFTRSPNRIVHDVVFGTATATSVCPVRT